MEISCLFLLLGFFSEFSCLFSIDHASGILTLVAAVIVPTTVTTVIVMPEDEHISGYSRVFGIFDGCYSVELLANSALNDLVLFVLM